jgi:hypothetical protein
MVILRLSPRGSCREGFKRLGILTVPSLYTYSILMFVVRNRNIYQTNNNIHHIYIYILDRLKSYLCPL